MQRCGRRARLREPVSSVLAGVGTEGQAPLPVCLSQSGPCLRGACFWCRTLSAASSECSFTVCRLELCLPLFFSGTSKHCCVFCNFDVMLMPRHLARLLLYRNSPRENKPLLLLVALILKSRPFYLFVKSRCVPCRKAGHFLM